MKFRVFIFFVTLAFVTSCSSISPSTLEDIDMVSVQLSFDVSKEGKPVNIKVLNTTHEGFRAQAKEDLSKWKYRPKLVDGQAVMQKGLSVQLDYKFEQPSN